MLAIDAVAAPGKGALSLPVPGPAGEETALTVLVVKGAAPGPTLVVLGAVHGDEFEGVLAIQKAYRQLDPQQIRGTVLAVPVVNLPAFAARSRITPQDGQNMARVFPGRPDGTITERIAWTVSEHLLRRADFLLDLHSSGTAMTSPTLVGYYAHPGPVGERAAAAARAFGAPVVWVHPDIAPGRTLSMAAELGIPALYTEATGGLRVRPQDLRIYTNGILNVMGYLGMRGRPPAPAPRYYLGGNGDTDTMSTFTTEGLFSPAVRVLQRVKAGEVIGTVRGLGGELLEEIRAPQSGRVAFLRAVPPVVPGELAVLIADEIRKD